MWSRKYNKCVDCGGTDHKHIQHGRCKKCFYRWRWANNPEYRAKHKILTYRWMKEHPEEKREIAKRANDKWRLNHLEEYRALYRRNAGRYYKNNKAKILAKQRERYHMKQIANIYFEGCVPVGTKIKFAEERLAYTVMASNIKFLVCTKPYNPKKTVLYTVVDLDEKIRGTEDLVFSCGAETKEQCEEMLGRLTSGESGISKKNRIKLAITKIICPQD